MTNEINIHKMTYVVSGRFQQMGIPSLLPPVLQPHEGSGCHILTSSPCHSWYTTGTA